MYFHPARTVNEFQVSYVRITLLFFTNATNSAKLRPKYCACFCTGDQDYVSVGFGIELPSRDRRERSDLKLLEQVERSSLGHQTFFPDPV